jgi:hypothetical protein
MRRLLSVSLFALSGCTFFNHIDDVVRPAADSGNGVTPEIEAGSEGGGDDGSVVVADSGGGPQDSAVDAIVDAGPATGIFVIAGLTGDGGGVAQLAVLSADDGHEIGNSNRYSIAANRKFSGLLYDGENEDVFYVFDSDPDDSNAPSNLHVLKLTPRTGVWKELSNTSNLPPLALEPSPVALHNVIAYRTNVANPPAGVSSYGIAFLNTKGAGGGAKVVAIPVGGGSAMTLNFNSVGLIGIPQAGDTSTQAIDVIHKDDPPCLGTQNDAGEGLCGVYLHRVSIANGGVSPLEMVTSPVGYFLWKTGAGISATTDLVRSQSLIVYPPDSYDGMGNGQGAVQAYDVAMHKPQLAPALPFGPVKSPWLTGTTVAQCERIVLTMGFITTPWLYAIPLDPAGTPGYSSKTIENGSRIFYDPVTHNMIAPSGTDLRPFTLGGTPSKPTVDLRTTGWVAPRDLSVLAAVVKAPLFPKCQ